MNQNGDGEKCVSGSMGHFGATFVQGQRRRGIVVFHIQNEFVFKMNSFSKMLPIAIVAFTRKTNLF